LVHVAFLGHVVNKEISHHALHLLHIGIVLKQAISSPELLASGMVVVFLVPLLLVGEDRVCLKQLFDLFLNFDLLGRLRLALHHHHHVRRHIPFALTVQNLEAAVIVEIFLFLIDWLEYWLLLGLRLVVHGNTPNLLLNPEASFTRANYLQIIITLLFLHWKVPHQTLPHHY